MSRGEEEENDQQKLSKDEHLAIVSQSYGMAYALSRMAQMDTSHQAIIAMINRMLLVGHLEPISDYELKLLDSEKLEQAAMLIGNWVEDFGRV